MPHRGRVPSGRALAAVLSLAFAPAAAHAGEAGADASEHRGQLVEIFTSGLFGVLNPWLLEPDDEIFPTDGNCGTSNVTFLAQGRRLQVASEGCQACCGSGQCTRAFQNKLAGTCCSTNPPACCPYTAHCAAGGCQANNQAGGSYPGYHTRHAAGFSLGGVIMLLCCLCGLCYLCSQMGKTGGYGGSMPMGGYGGGVPMGGGYPMGGGGYPMGGGWGGGGGYGPGAVGGAGLAGLLGGMWLGEQMGDGGGWGGGQMVDYGGGGGGGGGFFPADGGGFGGGFGGGDGGFAADGGQF